MGQQGTYVSSVGWLGQNEIQTVVVRQQSRYDTCYATLCFAGRRWGDLSNKSVFAFLVPSCQRWVC